jgi:hypothetical protein
MDGAGKSLRQLHQGKRSAKIPTKKDDIRLLHRGKRPFKDPYIIVNIRTNCDLHRVVLYFFAGLKTAYCSPSSAKTSCQRAAYEA